MTIESTTDDFVDKCSGFLPGAFLFSVIPVFVKPENGNKARTYIPRQD